jgi:hypothetical protein
MKTFLAGIPVLLLITAAALGDTLTVTNQDDSGPGSLRDAVMNATSGDTIKFDLPLPNTISLTSTILIDRNLTIAGPGADVLTVERSSEDQFGFPVFHIASGFYDITISGLTINNGLNGTGGGLENESTGTVTVTACTFTDNFAGIGGGAVSNEGDGTLALTDCSMIDNSTNGTGGAVFTKFGVGSVTLVRCKLALNTAKSGGGAVWNSGNDNNTLTLTDCTIDQNAVTAMPGESSAFGGGIYNDGMMTIEGCTISNDSTSNGSGGGLFNFDSVTVTNSTFYGNTASDSGGGIENAWIATISDCTITSNAASQLEDFGTVHGGGGLASAGGTFFNVTTIKNTIIARNDSPTNPDVAGEMISNGYNLIGDSTGGTIVPMTGDQIGTSEAPIDPMLGALDSNGGPTQTCALVPGSPAINVGQPDAPATDQRGYDRVDAPDIGAFELGATIPRTLGNISTRLLVETGDNVLIGGFIVTGTHSKPVLLRGVGPSLALEGKLADPVLELHDSAGAVIATNDDWGTNDDAQAIIDTGLAPADPKESALLVTLDPGAYTAIINGANESSGIALVEAYDLDQTTDAKLANISTRGRVQSGDDVMIGGLIVLGTLDETVLIRAIGPSLPVSDPLADPVLELHDGDGVTIATNDNWRDAQETEIEATGLPPNDDAEAALLATLGPGLYTAIVRGAGDSTGVALVEAYSLN